MFIYSYIDQKKSCGLFRYMLEAHQVDLLHMRVVERIVRLLAIPLYLDEMRIAAAGSWGESPIPSEQLRDLTDAQLALKQHA